MSREYFFVNRIGRRVTKRPAVTELRRDAHGPRTFFSLLLLFFYSLDPRRRGMIDAFLIRGGPAIAGELGKSARAAPIVAVAFPRKRAEHKRTVERPCVCVCVSRGRAKAVTRGCVEVGLF